MDDLTRLLVAARDGDRLSLAAAVRMSQPEVWRLAAHLVDPAEADDVTQEVFIRAWRALPAFRAEASGRTWLLVIARRTCVDAVRRRGRKWRLDRRLADAASVRSHAGGDSHGSEIVALVNGLEPERREAFVLTQLVGCSYAEAADVCDVPVGTIRSRVARARDDLVVALRAADTA